jgi:hypothetical protein
MVIFHAIKKPDLTILVSDFGVIQVIKNVFYAMFVFWQGFLHVSEHVSYVEDNIVLSYVYHVLDVNHGRMFWTITNGTYWIIDENVLNDFQNTIVTISTSTTTSLANIVVPNVVRMEKPNVVFHDSKFSILNVESLFINLFYYYYKNNLPFLMLLSKFS